MTSLQQSLTRAIWIGVSLAVVWGNSPALLAAEPTSDRPAAIAIEPTSTSGEREFKFNFRYQPWQDVLDWFAEQADLSLVLESPPPGTFNYHDSRSYTVAEALDVINSVLLTKGFTLVRSGRMLVLVNLEDGIPPNLVTDVPLAELDDHGEYEIIRVTFPVLNMSAEEAAKEVEHLIGPQGAVIVLPQSKRIQVTETGGRLRTIRSVINAVERPDVTGSIREITLKHLSVDDALPYLRQLLAIPDEAFSTPDGQLHIGKDVTGWKLLVHGTPERVARAQEVVRLIDVADAARGVSGAPQLEVYPITLGRSAVGAADFADPDGRRRLNQARGRSGDGPPGGVCPAGPASDDPGHDRTDAARLPAGGRDSALDRRSAGGGALDHQALRRHRQGEARSLGTARRRRHYHAQPVDPRHSGPGEADSRFALSNGRVGRFRRRDEVERTRAAAAALRRGGAFGADADRANLADDAAESDPRRDAVADDPDVPAERRCGKRRARGRATQAAGRSEPVGTVGDRAARSR